MVFTFTAGCSLSRRLISHVGSLSFRFRGKIEGTEPGRPDQFTCERLGPPIKFNTKTEIPRSAAVICHPLTTLTQLRFTRSTAPAKVPYHVLINTNLQYSTAPNEM